MKGDNYYIGASNKFMGLGVMFQVDPPYTTIRRSWSFELCLGWFKFWYGKDKKTRSRMVPLKDGPTKSQTKQHSSPVKMGPAPQPIKPNYYNSEKEIQRFMQSNPSFIEHKDCQGRRFVYMNNGSDVAYIWFKYGLNGWNLIFYNQSTNGERIQIESVEKLKFVLNIETKVAKT